MRSLTWGCLVAMLPWVPSLPAYADGSGEGVSLCSLPSRYCSATTALEDCTKDLVRHPGGTCLPVNARCDVGIVPHSAYTIRYNGANHHVYKYYPPGNCSGTNLNPVTYHAGVCPRNLDGLPVRFGTVRHDDFQSYKLQSGRRSDASTSGFYPDNLNEAIQSAWRYIWLGERIYVVGRHTHAQTSTCRLPIVSKARFNELRSRARTIIWPLYHLFFQNCQHWAREVVN